MFLSLNIHDFLIFLYVFETFLTGTTVHHVFVYPASDIHPIEGKHNIMVDLFFTPCSTDYIIPSRLLRHCSRFSFYGYGT